MVVGSSLVHSMDIWEDGTSRSEVELLAHEPEQTKAKKYNCRAPKSQRGISAKQSAEMQRQMAYEGMYEELWHQSAKAHNDNRHGTNGCMPGKAIPKPHRHVLMSSEDEAPEGKHCIDPHKS